MVRIILTGRSRLGARICSWPREYGHRSPPPQTSDHRPQMGGQNVQKQQIAPRDGRCRHEVVAAMRSGMTVCSVPLRRLTPSMVMVPSSRAVNARPAGIQEISQITDFGSRAALVMTVVPARAPKRG